MKPFAFVGHLHASKSVMNRLLVVQAYAPDLQIRGDSDAEDVRHMRQALEDMKRGVREINVGAGGTVLRFVALRAARLGGEFILRGTPRLFERPQTELAKILRQLSVESDLGKDYLRVKGDGWKLQGDTLMVPFNRSSQFATAVLINSWNLPFDLFVSLGGQKVSEGYWRLSVRMVHDLGMKLDFWDGDFRVPREQKVTAKEFSAEMDLSSAFAVAAVAAVSGTASFPDYPVQSFQPDAEFVRILASMGVPVALLGTTLRVEKAARLNGVAVNLRNSPDLFPVLAALCALADSESHLYGADQLVHKESNRLQRTAEMIRAFGRNVEVKEDGIKILGEAGLKPIEGRTVTVDCDQDHRMAFAAAVFRSAGFDVEIKNPEVVRKSFPGFWSVLGWDS